MGGGGGESGRLGRRSRDSKQPKSIAWRVCLFGLYIRKRKRKKVFKKRVVDGEEEGSYNRIFDNTGFSCFCPAPASRSVVNVI